MPELKLKSVFATLGIISVILSGCNYGTQSIRSGKLEIQVDGQMHTKIASGYGESVPLMQGFQASEFINTKHFTASDFKLVSHGQKEINNAMGKGVEYTFTGNYAFADYSLEKTLWITVYDNFPDMALFRVNYRNTGQRNIEVRKWVNNHYEILSNGDEPPFWSFQGGTTNARRDWVLPLEPGFYQQNFMGMTSSDYGGGIPVTDVWRRDAGIAVGHTSLIPEEVSLPVDLDEYSSSVNIGVEYIYPSGFILEPGTTTATTHTFVLTHSKDYFAALQKFNAYMKAQGIRFTETEEDAYGSMWCAWGYERNFTLEEIIGTLPKVKELGIEWVGIDDGFQVAEGDWHLDPKKFPNGDKDMRRLVDQIHANGLKAMIWWAPLAADPGSRILREDKDVLLFNDDWSPRYITWWDAWLMSPAYEGTITHTKDVLDMFYKTWDFDGIKIDGQHINAVPADYHPDHGLNDPRECIALHPNFFKMIIEYSRSIKPDAVVELCPCGCCINYYLTPYLNQAVSSDPTSSWQVRLKGKTYKAIIGPTAYFGDHVELIDSTDGFATQLGIGAVLGTKFTWPKDNPSASRSFLLTENKEKEWKKWFGLYNELMLPEGEYLGTLYDLGYDKPETHVIRKNDKFYYAFYRQDWKGQIELRGLDPGKKYSVLDYVNGYELGEVEGGDPFLSVDFRNYLLIEVSGK